MARQLLRSGTSIGALIREAEFAETKKDFIHKLAIAQKETNETQYWMELLKETAFVDVAQYESINDNITELLKLLTSSIKTAKKTLITNH